MHLRYDMYAAIDAGQGGHAQEVMRNLGITYQRATPQSIADQWWFWNCENVPDPLPAFLTKLDLDPLSVIGYGLSETMAIEIKKREQELASRDA